jgi:alpha-tubulin suppressor-like RCC1 family protein
VAIQDQFGTIVDSATRPITVALTQNLTDAKLTGTTAVAAVGGIATFGNLTVDRHGTYALAASSPGLTGGTSTSFQVTLTLTAIATGGIHTCATTTASATYCWGSNSGGQLGDGTTERRTIPAPATAPPNVRFETVSSGSQHTCGATADGVAYCWGVNTFGQLGNGTTENKTSPTPVQEPMGVSFVTVSAALNHTCGLSPAGAAYCWGLNGHGQLGNGTTENSPRPVAVAAPGGIAFVAIGAGYSDFTCALASSGAAYCWGFNAWGQLGNGDSTLSSQATPTPVLAPQDVGWTTLTTGGSHACALTAGGTAYCWGNNEGGKLGVGASSSRTTPTAVAGPQGATLTTVQAGGNHTCALVQGGAAYCWGTNSSGQLGNDMLPVNSTTPTPVLMPTGASFVRLGTGFSHTCALTATGRGYCWGSNTQGQLGNGSVLSSATPIAIIQ